MTWQFVRRFEQLRTRINAANPNRSKVSDGSIYDAFHSARESAHNPELDGTIDVVEVTHDPANEFNSQWSAIS